MLAVALSLVSAPVVAQQARSKPASSVRSGSGAAAPVTPAPPSGPVKLRRLPSGIGRSLLSRKNLPATLQLEVGESRVMEVGPDVRSIVGDNTVARVDHEPEHVRIWAMDPGFCVIVLVGREGSRSVGLRVVRPALSPETVSARATASEKTTRKQLDQQLRIRTGGAVRHGAVGASGWWSPQSSQVSLSAALDGVVLGHEYRMFGNQTLNFGSFGVVPGWAAGSFLVTGPHLEGRYGAMDGDSPLTFGWGSNRQRSASARLRFGPVDLGGDLRGPWDLSSLGLVPTGGGAELGLTPVEGLRVSIGALAPLDRLERFLPYAGLELSAAKWEVAARAGSRQPLDPEDTAIPFSVQLASPNDAPCDVTAAFADSAGQAAEFGSMLSPIRGILRGRAGCKWGGWSASVGALRTEFLQASGVIGQGSATLGFAHSGQQLALTGFYAPRMDGVTSQRQLQLMSNLKLGPVLVTANGRADFTTSRMVFGETLGFSFPGQLLVASVRASLLHEELDLRSLFVAGALTLRLPSVAISVQTLAGIPIGTGATLPPNAIATLAWRPASAWLLRVGTTIAFSQTPTWQLNGGLEWRFGDETEREPILGWLRSHSVRTRAYFDENADGKWDPDERAAEGLSVCFETRCVKTDRAGSAVLDGLPEVFAEIKLDEESLPGLRVSGDTKVRVPIGAYSMPVIDFGVRQRVPVKIRVLKDINGNGQYDFGEVLVPAARVKLRGANVDRTVEVAAGVVIEDIDSLGDFDFEVDQASVPVGYLLPANPIVSRSFADYAPREVNLGVIPLRSIQGEACVDDDNDGRCGLKEQRVSGISVSCGERVGVTDELGRFLLPRVLSSLCDLTVGELDLPAGVVQRQAPRFSVGDAPVNHRGIFIPLQRDPTAKRSMGVRFNWPKVGPAVVSELGGYTLDGKAFRPSGRVAEPAKLSTWKPAASDKVSIDRAAKLLKERQTMLSVQVSLDPALPDDKAKADAEAMSQAFVRWLTAVARVPADKIVTEVVPSTGRGATIGMRVYQFFRRLKPDEVKAMEEEKAAEREQRQRSLDEARKARDLEEGPASSGQPQPSSGSEVPLKRLDVRVRMRMNAR